MLHGLLLSELIDRCESRQWDESFHTFPIAKHLTWISTPSLKSSVCINYPSISTESTPRSSILLRTPFTSPPQQTSHRPSDPIYLPKTSHSDNRPGRLHLSRIRSRGAIHQIEPNPAPKCASYTATDTPAPTSPASKKNVASTTIQNGAAVSRWTFAST